MNRRRIVGIACALSALALSAGSAQTRPRRGGGIRRILRQLRRDVPAAGVRRQRAVRRPLHVRAHSLQGLRALGRARRSGLVARLSGRRRELHEDPARHHERASVHRAGADGRQRARRAGRPAAVQVSGELHVGAGRLASVREGGRRVPLVFIEGRVHDLRRFPRRLGRQLRLDELAADHGGRDSRTRSGSS